MAVKAQMRMESDERIIRAAVKVFGDYGYSHATLTKIAEEAGVSQGLVSQRFSSKESLLNEVFDQTQILSFYDEKNRHLPQTLYVLLDHLKQEVKDNPHWFKFLAMVHTGKDTPQNFEVRTKEMFIRTPIRAAIIEAQEQNDLPAGDPWDIFRVFFRNATNLIGWYHEFGLPMPENDYFLYAIQYNRGQKENEAKLKRQTCEIQTLQSHREILFTAVSEIYPLIIFSNLTQNSYYMMAYTNFTTKSAKEEGRYDDLISTGASTIPNVVHRDQFLRLFGRENVIQAYKNGNKQLYLRHFQLGDDGVTRWIETRMLFAECMCGDLLTVTLSRPIDDEMERLRSYGETLQKAELSASAKSRFLTNLSHNIRTPMNVIMGYTEMIRLRANDPEKILSYVEKMRTSENELMGLLAKALDAANISFESSGITTRVDINEASSGIIANAIKLAEMRGVTLNYKVGALQDEYIYTDEILLQRTTMLIILKAINDSIPGDSVQVSLEQLTNETDDGVRLRLTVHDNGVRMNNELVQTIINDSDKYEVSPDLAQLSADVRSLGGTMEYENTNEGNTVVCTFCFRREE